MPFIAPPPPLVFSRVLIDYMVLGGSRVSWTINEHFREPAPWTFQVQVAEADIDGANWTNVGAPVVNAFTVTDPTQRWYAKQDNAFYRVQLTTGLSNTYYSAPQNVFGKLDYHGWGIAEEIVRKETLRLEYLKVGINGFFLKAKHSGAYCTECTDPFTKEVTDSNCPTCYGQRWEGGYYTAVPAVFGDINPFQRYDHRELQAEGMVNTQIVEGIFVAMPFMEMNDVWVNSTSDLRYWIHNVDVLTHYRGVPLITKVQMRLVPTDNVIYTIPLS